ncbi:hypothetical protein E2C01_010387 [Portunus trituberculatus]|uniref:Uncharacterized protein n=1 Tax=Portunus trituberculatus TaxID=210409 RepID=A0A5B7D8J8_PORTR|nr:hypothetical protein [Portunus trituberculatus]
MLWFHHSGSTSGHNGQQATYTTLQECIIGKVESCNAYQYLGSIKTQATSTTTTTNTTITTMPFMEANKVLELRPSIRTRQQQQQQPLLSSRVVLLALLPGVEWGAMMARGRCTLHSGRNKAMLCTTGGEHMLAVLAV